MAHLQPMETTDSPAVQNAFAAHEERRKGIVELPPHRFEFGPYQAPLVAVGDKVTCARLGCVAVAGWTQGPFPWPTCQINGPHSLILFDDLERAVAMESANAVAIAWGVSRATVYSWRKTLGVARANVGTMQRWRNNAPLVIGDSHLVGLARSHAPAARLKAEATKRERGITPPNKRLWTQEQIGWMGQITDVAIARRVGCHPTTVERERRRHGIAPLPSACNVEGFEQISPDKLRARLLDMGLTQSQLAQRCGCAHSAINRLHRGAKTRITAATLKKIARILRCKPEDLCA